MVLTYFQFHAHVIVEMVQIYLTAVVVIIIDEMA